MPENPVSSANWSMPGRDPDPEGEVEKRVKIGWALVGMFFTASVFGFVINRSGVNLMPDTSDTLAFTRLAAFVVTAVNIGIWMWFPLEDLSVLRKWVRTQRKLFPAHTSELWAILLAMVLLVGLIVGAVAGGFWFGIAGAGVYLWNWLGFQLIRNHVAAGIVESRAIFSRQETPFREPLMSAVEAIESHWSAGTSHILRGWQQQRHFSLFLLFLISAALGFLARRLDSRAFELSAYWLGIVTIVFAEVTIMLRRTKRDRQLLAMEEELRSVSVT